MVKSEVQQLVQYVADEVHSWYRYLWYAGRPLKYYNNCFLLKAEQDTREDWAILVNKIPVEHWRGIAVAC